MGAVIGCAVEVIYQTGIGKRSLKLTKGRCTMFLVCRAKREHVRRLDWQTPGPRRWEARATKVVHQLVPRACFRSP